MVRVDGFLLRVYVYVGASEFCASKLVECSKWPKVDVVAAMRDEVENRGVRNASY